MKSFLLSLSFLVSIAAAANPPVFNKYQARLLLCNTAMYGNACGPSIKNGDGYGYIMFGGSTKMSDAIVLWPNGKTPDEAAIMAGKLQVYELMQVRKHKNVSSKYILSEPLVVTGYFTKAPLDPSKEIFNLTDFTAGN